MVRTTDLDTIAPDDLDIVATKEPSLTSKPVKKTISKPVKKAKKKKTTTIKPSTSKTQSYRQKVYKLLNNQTKTPLSSFLARPKVFSFDQRDGDEEIILVLRRHWFSNLAWLFTSLIMLLAPLSLSVVPFLESFPANYKIIAIIFWYLVTFIFTFEKFLSWYFNVFIITEERVLDIDFNNLIVKEVSDAKISMIQDLTYNVVGVAQTLLNFGTILIQTAAEIPEIVINQAPNPELVAKVLQQMRLEEEQEALEGRVK